MWSALPHDVHRMIHMELDDSADSVRMAAVSKAWRDAFDASPEIKDACAYRPRRGTTLRAISTHAKYLERIPPGTVRVLVFRIDVPSCPDFDFGVLRAIVERLCDVLDAQKSSLLYLSLGFAKTAPRPAVLRRMIRVVQSSFFRLQKCVGALARLQTLRLRACLMPLRMRGTPTISGSWLLVDLYPASSSIAPSFLITDLFHDAVSFETTFHVLIKPSAPSPGMGGYVVSRRVLKCLGGSLDVSEDGTVNVWGDDAFAASPCFIFFVMALRANNYAIFARGLTNRVAWKRVFDSSDMTIRLGFMPERLPF
jgi:hypothetical protein